MPTHNAKINTTNENPIINVFKISNLRAWKKIKVFNFYTINKFRLQNKNEDITTSFLVVVNF